MTQSSDPRRSNRTNRDAPTVSRRGAIGLIAGTAVAGVASWRAAFAQDDEETPEAAIEQSPIQPSTVGELPTTGAFRGGPVSQEPQQAAAANATQPSAIRVEAAQIDAEIEALNIVDGVMQNPTGPWVVAWYQETAQLGEPGNVVLAGHVDYWNVGPSVFYNIGNLAQGEPITLIGENGEQYTYAVEWVETYDIAAVTEGAIEEIVGPTERQAVTLITCGGEFDYVNGEYLSRTVVRGLLTPPESSTPEDTDG